MIAIKDMKMPKSCSECPFKANDYVCKLLDCAFSCNHFKERNYNCPLVEIVTCQNCIHKDPEYNKCDCGHDIIWQLPRDNNWYCADGERRE